MKRPQELKEDGRPIMKKRKRTRVPKAKPEPESGFDVKSYSDEGMPTEKQEDASDDAGREWLEWEGFSDDEVNKEQSTTASDQAELAEAERLKQAALNNRLHQLPHELLWMIVDYLEGPYDIANIAKAMIPPKPQTGLKALRWLELRVWFLEKDVRRIEETWTY